MKKTYTQPELTVTTITSESVITLSGKNEVQSSIKSVAASAIDF